jgi:hypothetical protein
MITYDLCREYREERESRMNEYRQLQRREPSVELNMINERDYNIQRHVRLTPISEEGENFNV